jgi:hypothetical protein
MHIADRCAPRKTADGAKNLILQALQPGGAGPPIYIPQGQCGSVIPPGTWFPFFASYYSQGFGGGILGTRMPTEQVVN